MWHSVIYMKYFEMSDKCFAVFRTQNFHNFVKVALTKQPKRRPTSDKLLEVRFGLVYLSYFVTFVEFILSRTFCAKHSWLHSVTVSNVGRINEVNQRRARLVLGWVTIFGWVNHLGM